MPSFAGRRSEIGVSCYVSASPRASTASGHGGRLVAHPHLAQAGVTDGGHSLGRGLASPPARGGVVDGRQPTSDPRRAMYPLAHTLWPRSNGDAGNRRMFEADGPMRAVLS